MASTKDRFWEIEGLRAWLAWAVVLSHVFILLNFFGFRGDLAPAVGDIAVKVFILISGFVITGLVVEQHEPYRPFIIRRAFRIFPVYLIALVAGALTTPLALHALAATSWGSDPGAYFFRSMQQGLASTNAYPFQHWLLHLTLLQGLVPDSALPYSSSAFVGPAWSLSLEWQFYVLAPALVWLMRAKHWTIWIVLFAFVSAFLFQRGVFGTYAATSSILGGLWLFVIGIASRLAFPALRAAALPAVPIAAACIGIGVLAPAIGPVAIWLAFVALLARPVPVSAPDSATGRIVSTLLTSPLAKALGARSYSVYILHIPIMKLLLFLLPLSALTQLQAFFALSATAVVLTLIGSEITYRLVERPMMRKGAALAAGGSPHPHAHAPSG